MNLKLIQKEFKELSQIRIGEQKDDYIKRLEKLLELAENIIFGAEIETINKKE
jgi:hypothetical protein